MFNILHKPQKCKLHSVNQSIKMTAIANDDEMALSEHIEEFSQRLVFCVLILIIATIFVILNIVVDIIYAYLDPKIKLN